MENRKSGHTRGTSLPADYLKLVGEIFGTNFSQGLKALEKLTRRKGYFLAEGTVYANEVVLSISLILEKQLAATTVHASSDFDPKASSPTLEDLLAACVDGVGAVFGDLLTPGDEERLAQVADETLAALEKIPFDWTDIKLDRKKIFVKVDKSNPALDKMTSDWLAKNDPKYKELEKEEQEETEKLFVTGPKKVH